MRDFDDQINRGVREPVFDAQRFADMGVEPQAWVLEPQDSAALAPAGAAPTAQAVR